MADIKIKDVESFGRVLKRLGQFVEENPEKLLDLLASSDSERMRPEPRDVVGVGEEKYPELDNLSVFEMAKDKGKRELLAFLEQYSVDQLRYLIRRLKFSALKSKSHQTLAEYIADQAVKRSVDIFTTHETSREQTSEDKIHDPRASNK